MLSILLTRNIQRRHVALKNIRVYFNDSFGRDLLLRCLQAKTWPKCK